MFQEVQQFRAIHPRCKGRDDKRASWWSTGFRPQNVDVQTCEIIERFTSLITEIKNTTVWTSKFVNIYCSNVHSNWNEFKCLHIERSRVWTRSWVDLKWTEKGTYEACNNQNSFQHFPRCRFWWVITTLYQSMLQWWYQKLPNH